MNNECDHPFNFLFCNTVSVYKASKLMQIILMNRDINSNLNPYLHCSTEQFISNVSKPATLKQLCLRYFHLQLAFKVHIGAHEKFVNYLHTPVVIENLPLPHTLKLELLHLYVQCAAHCNLVTKLYKDIKCTRYVLKPNLALFRKLNSDKNWPKILNKRFFTIQALLDKIYDLGITNIPSYEFHKWSNFEIVLIQCH